MKLIKTVLIIFLLLSMNYLAGCGGGSGGGGGTSGSWKYLGPSDGISAAGVGDLSIFIYNGTPYVAYRDESLSCNGEVTVKKFNGSNWETVGDEGFSNGASTDISLYVYNGTPYVAYTDWDDGKKAKVMKYDNVTGWGLIELSASSVTSYDNSLYVYNGTPYIAYQDWVAQRAIVKYHDGAAWVQLGSPLGTSDGSSTSLVINNGIPYVAFKNAGKAAVYKYVSGNWQPVGSQSTTDTYFVSLAFDNTTPYLAYQDENRVINVKKYIGGSWQQVGLPGFSDGEVYGTKLSVSNGIPYVVYDDDFTNEDKLSVMKYTGDKWMPVGSPRFTPANTNNTFSFFVYSGTPYLAFNHQAIEYKLVVLKYD